MSSPRRPSLLSPWDLLALAAFGGLWAFYSRILPSLPDPVPTHFNALGQANGWTSKAGLARGIFGLPILTWAVLTVLGILLSLVQKEPARARAAAMQPLRGLLGTGLALLMGSSLLAPAQGPRIVLPGLAGLLILVGVGIVLTAREHAGIPPTEAGDDHYRWGLFYVNAQDPRLLVEKRVGIGMTLNFGRPGAWLFLAVILLPALVLLALVKAF